MKERGRISWSSIASNALADTAVAGIGGQFRTVSDAEPSRIGLTSRGFGASDAEIAFHRGQRDVIPVKPNQTTQFGAGTAEAAFHRGDRDVLPPVAISYPLPDEPLFVGEDISLELIAAEGGRTKNTNNKPNFYDHFLGSWELGKHQVLNNLDQAAIADGGGFITAGAALVKFPAELGFGLFDSGLSLGGIAASPNVRQYQIEQWKVAWDDFKTTSNLVAGELVTDIFSGEDDIRFTVDSDLLFVNGKAVIGSDFYGAQFKNVATTGTSKGMLNSDEVITSKGMLNSDEVIRYASDWNGNNSTAIILEKSTSSFSLPLPKSWKSGGISVGVSVGARYNETTSQARSAINFKVQTPWIDFGIDWRGANHKTYNKDNN